MSAIGGKADIKLGWTEGSNLRLELRWSAGDAGKARTSAKGLSAAMSAFDPKRAFGDSNVTLLTYQLH